MSDEKKEDLSNTCSPGPEPKLIRTSILMDFPKTGAELNHQNNNNDYSTSQLNNYGYEPSKPNNTVLIIKSAFNNTK